MSEPGRERRRRTPRRRGATELAPQPPSGACPPGPGPRPTRLARRAGATGGQAWSGALSASHHRRPGRAGQWCHGAGLAAAPHGRITTGRESAPRIPAGGPPGRARAAASRPSASGTRIAAARRQQRCGASATSSTVAGIGGCALPHLAGSAKQQKKAQPATAGKLLLSFTADGPEESQIADAPRARMRSRRQRAGTGQNSKGPAHLAGARHDHAPSGQPGARPACISSTADAANSARPARPNRSAHDLVRFPPRASDACIGSAEIAQTSW